MSRPLTETDFRPPAFRGRDGREPSSWRRPGAVIRVDDFGVTYNAAKRPSAIAIAYAFREAAKSFPGDLDTLRSIPGQVLRGRVAHRSRWIAMAALREAYGAPAMHFLASQWPEHSVGRALSGFRRASWWDEELVRRLASSLRYRFGG